MIEARRTILIALVAALLAGSLLALAGHRQVAIGAVLGVAAGTFSLFTISLFAQGVAGLAEPRKGHRLAWFWIIVKLPVLGALVLLTSSAGPGAVWSFVAGVASVYSLLLCLAWAAARPSNSEAKQDAKTNEDDT